MTRRGRVQEARAIAQVDVLWQQEEIILQHLVATHGYLLGVSQCEQARQPRRLPS